MAVVQLLILKGASLNQQGGYSRTPLHWACENKCVEVASALLEAGVSVNVTDMVGGRQEF